MSDATLPASDGRRVRRERGRQAVLDAVVDLLHVHGRAPTTSEITERSGVSSATIFRYFASLDDLQHQATEHHFARSRHLFEIPDPGSGPLDDRIHRYVATRVELHAHIAPVARYGRSQALSRPLFAANLRQVRRWQADLARAHFATEVAALTPAAGDDLVAAIATLTSFESWDQLTTDLDRTDRQIRRAWTTALTSLLNR
ncbi:MAG: TetR/AcrR family transcriptional regulator [Acidimicrobiales bacterium]|nr:TetR/AcrR family transcriptional regulator [Acidimicrobiales bacterium]